MDSLSLAGLGLAEDRIQHAVRTNDAAALALILHDDLLATGPDGRIVGKKEDVAPSTWKSACLNVLRDEVDVSTRISCLFERT